ncbi:MAG: DUF2007 domain-containing protein [Chitinophagaceae bacterium]|nr:DUF2007 domain-containing protein [Chitinophagaceae bacterium]
MNQQINWKCVYKTNSEFAANALKGNLEHAGLNPVVVNKRDSSFTIGYVEIHVPEDQEAEALLLVEDLNDE